MICPVTYPLMAGEARKSTLPTHSAGVPARPLRPYSSGGAAVALDLTPDQ